MTELRIKKNSNFVVLDKTCANDVSLSLQAKGLHTLLMGFPSDWKIHLRDIVGRSSNDRDATRKAFSELESKGYITKEQLRDGGKFGVVEYIVLEQPDLKSPPCEQIDNNISPKPENPYTVNSPRPGKPGPVNPTRLNNNKLAQRNDSSKSNHCGHSIFEKLMIYWRIKYYSVKF